MQNRCIAGPILGRVFRELVNDSLKFEFVYDSKCTNAPSRVRDIVFKVRRKGWLNWTPLSLSLSLSLFVPPGSFLGQESFFFLSPRDPIG